MSKTKTSVKDAYCTSGTSPTVSIIGPKDAPAILILGGISAKSDLSWWSPLVGHNKIIDPSHYRIISTNWLLDSQANTQIQAQWILEILNKENIQSLYAAIGCSYGGMVALALGQIAPDRVQHIVAIGAAHRPHALATAWRFIQRQLAQLGTSNQGLALARALAMTTYRSDRELDARFGDKPQELQQWLEHHGESFTRRFSVDEYIALSNAIDQHLVTPEQIPVPTVLVGFDSDLLVPPWLLDELEQRLPNVARYELCSIYGHDAFLKETDAIAAILSTVLDQSEEVAA